MSRTPDCPFCDAREVELISRFGSQILTSQWVCHRCRSYFEAIREDFDDEPRRVRGAQPSNDAK
jgi:hypothetical protein